MGNESTEKTRKASRAKELLNEYPLTAEELSTFLQSEKRINRILGIDKFKNAQIVAEIVESTACIAGHSVGYKIYFDSMGRLLPQKTEKPLCSRLLNKVWYRLILILDRMADDTGNYIGKGDFFNEMIEVRMSCYSAIFPYGDCGYVLMKVCVENTNA